jgi:TPR repeat protein
LADQGSDIAQSTLGFIYWNGDGVPKNEAEAVKLFHLAADQGNAFAQAQLGFVYLNGFGAPQDYILSHMWSSLSAAQGMPSAMNNRELVEKRMTREQIAEAQKLAREWKPTR